MKSPSDGATDVSEETAPESGVVEQKPTSFENELLKLAAEQGLMAPAKLESPTEPDEPQDQGDPEIEETEETEVPATPAEGVDPDEEEESPPVEGKLDKLVPLREVIEERGKKQRANERAERIEAELAQTRSQLADLQKQLSQASGPMPTPDSPLIDVQEPVVLDRLERVYELLEEVDIENLNEDGTVTVPSAIGQDGKVIYAKIDPEQARLAQKRADRVLRKDIPNRRKYLAERAQIDAGAAEWYPDLKNSDNEFARTVNQLTNEVLNGRAMQSPDIKFWVANAVYGFMKRREESQASNGNGATSGVKQIVNASKQKLAPTAPRTRAVVERKSSADLAKVEERFQRNPDDKEAAADYVAAVLSGKNRQKTVQPAAG